MLTALRATVEAPATADMPHMRTRTTRTHTFAHASVRAHIHTCAQCHGSLCAPSPRTSAPPRTAARSHRTSQRGASTTASRTASAERHEMSSRPRRRGSSTATPAAHTHEPQRTNAGTRFDGDNQRHVRVEGVMHTRWWQRWRDSTAMGTPAKRIITRIEADGENKPAEHAACNAEHETQHSHSPTAALMDGGSLTSTGRLPYCMQ